ncbi:MAG: glycosyltransferase family 4 protein [Myxococcota bacterium]
MRWHLVTPEWPPFAGGVATWAREMAGALSEAGEEVTVHARDGTPPAIRMRGRSWARWGAVWAAASVLPRLRSGDRILCATWEMAPLLLGRAPLAVVWHGSDITRPPRRSGRARVIAGAVNLPVSRYLGGLLGAPHTVLPAPIDPVAPATRGEALLVVARLGALKGVDRALRLARRLGRPITVVGDGPERAALEGLARELGARARFTGALPRHEIPWEGTWALVLLSRPDADGSGQEGLGLVLLEAHARGIPTIGSTTGGIPEVASVVLADPEHDPVPTLPHADAVRARLRAEHGRARAVAVLRASLADRG